MYVVGLGNAITNSTDPDQTAPQEQSDQDLHYLQAGL